jgi:membrane protease YdiL (CAAX protease family)
MIQTSKSIPVTAGRHYSVIAIVGVIGLAITFVPQGMWSALVVLNLRLTPALPWAVALMAVILWSLGHYLNGRWRPSRTSETRRLLLRATAVPPRVLLLALGAGAFAMVALAGYWTVCASFVRMPGSVLPDLSLYPWWTAALAVLMGALISPLCEQAGLFGYWQTALEREFAFPIPVLLAAIAFAVFPHPPAHAPLWVKLPFFFFTGLTFSLMAYYTKSIVPALAIHIVGLFMFFVFVWPADRTRPLIHDVGTNAWLWTHVAQAVIFSALAAWMFGRLYFAAGRAAHLSNIGMESWER